MRRRRDLAGEGGRDNSNERRGGAAEPGSALFVLTKRTDRSSRMATSLRRPITGPRFEPKSRDGGDPLSNNPASLVGRWSVLPQRFVRLASPSDPRSCTG